MELTRLRTGTRRAVAAATRVRLRLAVAASRGVRRLAADFWPLVQGTAAAAAAWVIAHDVLGRPEPFFAPISALIALNTSLGERGLNALRLLQGVFVGIVAGELTLGTLGSGFGSLAVATFLATATARILSDTRLVVAQAAASAILTIAIAGEAGVDRLTDALIGAGVALVFSQLLFSPQPVGLLRQAEIAALERMARALALSARALTNGDEELATRAVAELRELPDDVIELRRRRRASARVARRTLAGRSQRELVVREAENADHLDLLGVSCMAVARTVPSLDAEDREALAPSVRALAGVLAELAAALAERSVRQRAAERAFAVATAFPEREAERSPALGVAVIAVRLLAIDVIVFAGVEVEDAVVAVREGLFEREVREPVAEPRPRVGLPRSRVRPRFPSRLRPRLPARLRSPRGR